MCRKSATHDAYRSLRFGSSEPTTKMASALDGVPAMSLAMSPSCRDVRRARSSGICAGPSSCFIDGGTSAAYAPRARASSSRLTSTLCAGTYRDPGATESTSSAMDVTVTPEAKSGSSSSPYVSARYPNVIRRATASLTALIASAFLPYVPCRRPAGFPARPLTSPLQ
ncbi:unknown [Bifidobacterium bifidum CAG:234]|nr:unknown [Bifidobacterium bifidum CAG:234]